MIRSPHRRLAHLDTSPATVARAVDLVPRRLVRLSTKAASADLAGVPKRRVALDLTPTVPITRRAPLVLEPVRPRTSRATVIPPLTAQRKFPVASLDLSRTDITLPFGIGRYTNAATLKIIAGGHRADQLLKRTRAGWAFVPDHTRIDLADNRQEFRLGELTIFS